MNYRCPACKSNEDLSVVVKQWAALCYNDDGELEGTDTDSDICPDHDQEWDGESTMKCGCGFLGKARDFDEDAHEESEEERAFTVSVCRIGYGHTDIDVTARSIAEAESKAIEAAYNICFSDKSSEYVVDTCCEITAGKS